MMWCPVGWSETIVPVGFESGLDISLKKLEKLTRVAGDACDRLQFGVDTPFRLRVGFRLESYRALYGPERGYFNRGHTPSI